MPGPFSLAQSQPPSQGARVGSNLFYPQARVTLSVVFENFGDPAQPKVFPVVPRSIQVFSNSYNEADTWSVEFDARDLPVSPELIRGGAVEIYLFQTRGLGQIPETIRASDPDSAIIDGLEPTIVGLFDEVQLDMGEDGRFITIDGTDYTSLFLAKQWTRKAGNGRGRIPTGKRLDQILEQLMRQVESADAMTLSFEGTDLEGTPLARSSLPIVGAAEGRAHRKGIPVRQSESYWDVMYNLAVRYGYILFVRGLKVVLTTPQAYVAGRSKDRKMAWGRNLLNIRLNRRIGKVQVPVIEVRSYDEKRRKVIIARYPKNKKQKPVTGLGTKRDEVHRMTIPGISSKAQLERVAETVYNLRGRSEQTVEIETRDLRDLEGTDLLELRAGDALSIGFDPFNQYSVLIEGQSEDQRRATLVDLGYEPTVATAIAASFDRINLFKRPFRVKEVTFDWSHDGGVSIAAQLQNFVNIADLGQGSTAP